eukprot:TRINITY_DN19342_c0_g1_i1.p1 TRINITY_DN19342_c0_g1~~TRINITY_DN19342_c0_g1_i1.p1  ORF type:complete len:132 (+),score=18.80 TRINITY_DN19342_c0_g1_i1:1-396(+)
MTVTINLPLQYCRPERIAIMIDMNRMNKIFERPKTTRMIIIREMLKSYIWTKLAMSPLHEFSIITITSDDTTSRFCDFRNDAEELFHILDNILTIKKDDDENDDMLLDGLSSSSSFRKSKNRIKKKGGRGG